MRPYVLRRPLIGLVLLYMAFLSFSRFRGWEPAPGPRDPHRFAAGQNVRVVGRLDRDPDYGRGFIRFVLRAEKITPEYGVPAEVSGRILVQAQRLPYGAGWGDRIVLRGKLSPFPQATVPGSFDARTFWARRGIFSKLAAREKGWLLEKAPASSPKRWLSFLRRNCLKVYRRRLSRPAAELVSGLVLGKKPAGFPDMDRDFRRSGTYHLLVASGSNVGFIIGLWALAAWWMLGLPRAVVLVGAIPCAWIYTGMAGMDPPVTRAAVMVTFGLIALLIEREDRLAQALALSAGLLLALRPSALFEAGFQMSYSATLGILLGLPALESLVRHRSLWVRWTAAIFFTGFAAQLALSPMLLYYFHRFSWIGLLANLVAAPWAGFCLALGVILALMNLSGLGWLAAGTAWLTDKSALGLWRAVELFAKVPGAEWTPPWNGLQTALLSVIVVATFLVWGAIHPRSEESASPRPDFRRHWLLVVAIWACGLPALYAARSKPEAGRLSVVWLDAGAGDAQVVTSPAGRVTLVNGGGANFGTYKLVPFLRRRAVAMLHRVILTRADARHAPGLSAVLGEFPVDEFLCPESVWENFQMKELRKVLQKKKIPVRFLATGKAWIEDSVEWRALPSIALTATLGGQTALFANDLSPRAQKKIAALLLEPLSVLQSPGHGAGEVDENFLADANPRWIVSSSKELSREAGAALPGSRVFVTGRDGSVEWRTDGKTAECNLLAKPLEYPPRE